MSTFDESLHPRQRTGEFANKHNDAPTGTLTAEPSYLALSSDPIPAYKIQPSDQPGIWLTVDRDGFVNHLGLHPDNSDETVAATLRLLDDAQIDAAFIDETYAYEDPGTTPTPIDTAEWGPEWSDAYAWTGEDDPDSRYVRATQTITLDPWPAAASASEAMAAYTRFLILIDGAGDVDDTEVSTTDGTTFTVQRTVALTAAQFGPEHVRDAMTASAPAVDRLRRASSYIRDHGVLISDENLRAADHVNIDAVIAARRFGRPLSDPDLAAFAGHLHSATHGLMEKEDRDALLNLSRGFVEDRTLAGGSFDRVTKALTGANRDIASTLADAFRNR